MAAVLITSVAGAQQQQPPPTPPIQPPNSAQQGAQTANVPQQNQPNAPQQVAQGGNVSGQQLVSQDQVEISVSNPPPVRYVQPLLNPFHIQKRVVSAAKLSDTPRLEELVRAGHLYLSKDDVIALALENNIDIAVQRYAPLLSQEVLRRAEGGAALRDISVGIAAGPQSISLNGVSVNSVGLAGGGSGVSSGGGLVVSTGVSPVSLDPYLAIQANFAHTTTPLSNLTAQFVPFFLDSSRFYAVQYGQSWATGTSATMTFSSQRQAVNSPGYPLNPYTSGSLDLTVSQPLLQGLGFGVNKRFIKVAKNNIKVSDLQFKLQVVTTISAILNVYWDLVSFDEDLRIKQKGAGDRESTLRRQQASGRVGNAAADRSDACGSAGFAEQGRPVDFADQRRAAGNHFEERAKP